MLNPSASTEALHYEEQRLGALRRYHILDSAADPAFDRLVALAVSLFGTPCAGIGFVDADRTWVKARNGVFSEPAPHPGSFAAGVLRQNDVLVVEDSTADPRFRDNPLVVGPPYLRFYAGAPLCTPDGFTIGLLYLADTAPRVFPAQARARLALLAAVAMREVEVHQALHRLEESGQRYRALFEQNQDAVYSFDREGRFLSANAACETLSGYSPQELLQMSFDELVVPEHLAHAREMFEKVLEGEAQHDEFTIRRKDGRRVEINVSKMPVVRGGEIVGAYGISRDISARKALEREWERLLAAALERADRDPLTGLLNHRAFHKRFQEEIERARRAGRPLAVVLLDLDDFRFLNDAYGHMVGDDVLCRVAGALRERTGPGADLALARFGGDEFAALLASDRAEEAEAPATWLNRLQYCPPGHDSAIPLTLSVGVARFPDDGITHLDLLRVAEARLHRAKTGGGAQADCLRATLAHSVEGFSMLDALATAVDNKDRYTRRHSEDVLSYSVRMAQALGLDEKTQRVVATAALLHDVGKIGVPDSILRKPGKLTEAEYQAIQQHPMMGVMIVGAVPGFEGTLDAVQHHHERWDGQGYPFGLRGEEIPLLARLMAVADAFSAMTADRPYRKGMCPVQALAVLEQGAGTQWDPECVHAFVRMLSDCPPGGLRRPPPRPAATPAPASGRGATH